MVVRKRCWTIETPSGASGPEANRKTRVGKVMWVEGESTRLTFRSREI